MEVRIGVLHTPKELSLEVPLTADEVATALDRALDGDGGVLWLEDAKGRRVGIPAERVAYVEVEPDGVANKVGFGKA